MTLKRRIEIIAAVLTTTALSLGFNSGSKHTEKNELVMQITIRLLAQNHFAPPEINDAFSEKVFDNYINTLDHRKLYFTNDDIAMLSAYEHRIDNQIRNNTYEFYELSRELIDKRHAEVQRLTRKILALPFNFTIPDEYDTDASARDWTHDKEEQEQRWQQELKYRTLIALVDLQKAKERALPDDSIRKKSFFELEAMARKTVQTTCDNDYAAFKQEKDDIRFTEYMNAITAAFDPHTVYQAPLEIEEISAATVRNASSAVATEVKSAILTIPNGGLKVGYLSIPEFYTNNGKNGHTSSDDVADELQKLIDDGVSGVIVDLRNSSNGSLQEAVRTAGLFVGSGAIAQTKLNVGMPRQLSHNGVAMFDGNMVVIVNAATASTSELFAAAMQDCQRAIIIGGAQTFGYGTGQMLDDLDEHISPQSPYNRYKPLGTILVTSAKYFRVTGSSTQMKGVAPDIVLPDSVSALEIGERFLTNPIPWTAMKSADVKIWKNSPDVAQLCALSKRRTMQNEAVEVLAEHCDALQTQKNQTKISLKINDFRKAENMRNERDKSFKALINMPTTIIAKPTTAENNVMAGNADMTASANRRLKALTKDAIVEEAVNIIGDMK